MDQTHRLPRRWLGALSTDPPEPGAATPQARRCCTAMVASPQSECPIVRVRYCAAIVADLAACTLVSSVPKRNTCFAHGILHEPEGLMKLVHALQRPASELAREHLYLACAMIRGALCHLGVDCIVSADAAALPACDFTIVTKAQTA